MRMDEMASHPQKACDSITSNPSGSNKSVSLGQELKPFTIFNSSGNTRVRKFSDPERAVSFSYCVDFMPCGKTIVTNRELCAKYGSSSPST